MTKLSVIIPAYNAEFSIGRCLDSIYNSGLNTNDYEIIIVDDCSIDRTNIVISQYLAKHSNIVYIRQDQNKKQGTARNKGLDVAQGKYVVFVDADDSVDSGLAESLDHALNNDLDICFYTLRLVFYDKTIYDVKWKEFKNEIYGADDFLNMIFDYSLNGPTRGVFRREMIEKCHLRFLEGCQWEDGDFCLKLYNLANRIGYVNSIGYNYYQTLNSTTQHPSVQAIADQLRLGIRLMEYVKSTFSNGSAIYGKTISEVQNRYTKKILRIGNLLQYKNREVKDLYKILTDEQWRQISQWAPDRWSRIVTEKPLTAKLVLNMIRPFRAILSSMYKILKNR